jgi:HlyD family secretion protein
MPQSTEPSEILALAHRLKDSARLTLSKRPWLQRFLPAAEQRRQQVFFDSPGLLEQSSHWGGLVIWTIAAGTTAALFWAFLGKVDQTVTATGTLEPASGKLVVKSPGGGIVRELWVKDGQYVSKGTLLMRVENDGVSARLLATRKQLAILQYENQLYNLLLDQEGRLSMGSLPSPPPLIAGDEKTRSVQLTVQQTAAQLRQLQARVGSLGRTLALKRDLVRSMTALYRNGGYAKYNYLTSVDELQQFETRLTETREQITSVLADAGRQTSSNERQILGLEAEIVALNETQRNLTLKAAQSGRIFNLSVGPGVVIGGGAEVMRIIPEGGLKAKVYLPNSELGFVKPSLPVKLAVSSFPPGEYGYLQGTVQRIGADALSGDAMINPTPQQQNTYPMVIQLGPNRGKEAMLNRLEPGMQVSANIIVRQRPVITLLTDVFTKGTETLQNSR